MTKKLVCAATAVAFAALVGGDVLTLLTAVNMAVSEAFSTSTTGFGLPLAIAALPTAVVVWWAWRAAWRTEIRLGLEPDLIDTGPGTDRI